MRSSSDTVLPVLSSTPVRLTAPPFRLKLAEGAGAKTPDPAVVKLASQIQDARARRQTARIGPTAIEVDWFRRPRFGSTLIAPVGAGKGEVPRGDAPRRSAGEAGTDGALVDHGIDARRADGAALTVQRQAGPRSSGSCSAVSPKVFTPEPPKRTLPLPERGCVP